MVAAVIVAAGAGRRMGSALPKQVLPLAGRPLVEHSLRAFQRAPSVDRIVLVLPAGFAAVFPLKLGAIEKLAATVAGGETRQASVRNGLEAIAGEEWVVVHDAARPLVMPTLIEAVLAAARDHGAAVAARPARDTVKQVDGRVVVGTFDRDRVVLVQTPQAFRAELLRRAHREAAADGFLATDDAQLVERLGEPVAWVEGPATNLKVTTADDLRLAEMLLREPRAGR